LYKTPCRCKAPSIPSIHLFCFFFLLCSPPICCLGDSYLLGWLVLLQNIAIAIARPLSEQRPDVCFCLMMQRRMPTAVFIL
jgi:hypothetical protein